MGPRASTSNEDPAGLGREAAVCSHAFIAFLCVSSKSVWQTLFAQTKSLEIGTLNAKLARGARVPQQSGLLRRGALLKQFAASRGAPWPAFTSISEKFEPGGCSARP